MEIVNRVAESDLVTFNLEALWDGRTVDEFDLAPFLVEGLVLRERPFREAVAAYDWAQHAGRHVALFCSTDALVPVWAWLLVAAKLDGVAASVAHGRAADLVRDHFVRALEAHDWARYAGKPVVVKGCGSKLVPLDAYVVATRKLQAVAGKLMFGEACSSVPLWRRPKEAAGKAAPARPAGPPRPAS